VIPGLRAFAADSARGVSARGVSALGVSVRGVSGHGVSARGVSAHGVSAIGFSALGISARLRLALVHLALVRLALVRLAFGMGYINWWIDWSHHHNILDSCRSNEVLQSCVSLYLLLLLYIVFESGVRFEVK